MIMAMGVMQTLNGRTVEGNHWDIRIEPTAPAHMVRFIAYHTNPLQATGISHGLQVSGSEHQDPNALARQCANTLDRALSDGEETILHRQKAWLDSFWNQADIEIDSGKDKRIQQIVRWELFQLAQTTAFVPNGISAKGLSGSGYSGHYFWDEEVYILPFLTYTRPELSRSTLSFRYRMLPAARRRAAAMSLDGALFPWRTINGEEASAFFPAGSAQYHIDADIAFAVAQYVAVAGDRDFLLHQGIDILVETARMWVSLGCFGHDGRFHINCVTGPDEYSALVDDNYYTNSMAQFNLETAAQWMKRIEAQSANEAAEVKRRLTIVKGEVESWTRASQMMALLKDEETGVNLQDRTFIDREPWDLSHNAARPLLLYYHPLVIYRHQVLKQADVVLALFLLSSRFSLKQKLLDFDFYDPLTTGDSTLSSSSQAIIAAEVGHNDLAMKYFLRALFMDVADLHSNTADGIHLASAAGIWATLVAGFGGLRDTGGTHISINPHLPQNWKSMTYQLVVSGSRLKITVTHEHVDVTRMSGVPVSIDVQGNLKQI
jgi:alpha,alpha-trehalose phosphorylase